MDTVYEPDVEQLRGRLYALGLELGLLYELLGCEGDLSQSERQVVLARLHVLLQEIGSIECTLDLVGV